MPAKWKCDEHPVKDMTNNWERSAKKKIAKRVRPSFSPKPESGEADQENTGIVPGPQNARFNSQDEVGTCQHTGSVNKTVEFFPTFAKFLEKESKRGDCQK